MPRGGYHPHAERWGRPSGWKNASVTKTIRVPESLVDQVLDLAHKLDEGEVIAIDTEPNQFLKDEVSRLKAELDQLQEECDQLDQEVNQLHALNGDLDLQITNLQEKLAQTSGLHFDQLPDLESVRDRIVSSWKVQKRAESKDRIKEALDKFIALVRSHFEAG